MKIENYIVMAEVIYQGNFEDYIDKAEELADKQQMPVRVDVPCRRTFFVMPLDNTVQ